MKSWYVAISLPVVVLIGCVEIQQLLQPKPADTGPVFNFNKNENLNENVSTNGAANENGNANNANVNENANANENANVNENVNGNGNANANENANDNTSGEIDVAAINRGEVGDIPAISDSIEEQVTESGLRIFDIVRGAGDIPQADSTVTVNYSGWLASDGTKFDSADEIQFNLQSVIEGWTEGISTMQVGGTRRLIIPPDLAYGAAGRPPTIPANSTLVFDVELLDFQ